MRTQMNSRDLAGLLLLTVATACGARTELPSDGDGAAGGPSSSCTLEIDKGSTVSALIAEGERIYYVENHGRVMAVDADTGEGKVLAQVPIQGLGITVGLALDADWLYVTFIAPGFGFPALWQVSKAGGEPKLIAPGDRIDNVFVDETGVYWTNFLPLESKHVVFRRRPEGTVLSLGAFDDTYHDDLRGIFRGTAGLLVASPSALFAFDIEGAGPTKLVDVKRISYPFERDGALFYNVDPCSPYDLDPCTASGFYRALPDGTMAQQLYDRFFQRVMTDGAHWVFTFPVQFDSAIFGASYPDGEPTFIYRSPIYTSERAVALTPTRLVLGTAWWEIGAGIQSICRDSIGL
jgi:hypothetical protein